MNNIANNINRKDVKYIIILILVTGFLYFFALGDMALTEPDETFYAQTAKEMFFRNEWVTPMIFGEAQFEKPVFYYWTVMAGYKMFGISEFAARFFSAVFGVFGVIGVYFLGRFLFSRSCGFFSGLVLATCAQYFVLARACVTDMVLAVFILYCLLFMIMGLDRDKKKYYVYAAIMAAFAVLTKGPIGLFIPGMIYLIYLAVTWQWKKLRYVPFFSSIAVFLLIAAPWYLEVTRIHGASFLNEFFGFQNVTRFLEPEHKIGSSPFFYIPVLLGGLFPWSLFFPLGIGTALRKENELRTRDHGKFLLVWFLVVFLFFSVSRTKLVTYIFPLYPAAAIFIGRLWGKFINNDLAGKTKTLRAMSWSYYIFAGLSMAAIVGILIFIKIEYPEALYGTIIAVTVFGAGILMSLVAFLKNKKEMSFYAIIVMVMAVLVPINSFILPEVERFESRKELSLMLKDLAEPGEAIGGECDHRRGIAYYTDNPQIEDINNFNAMRDFFMRKSRVWGIMKRKHYNALVEEYPGIVSEPLAQAGKMVLVKNNV